MTTPAATYRVQLHAGFGFDDVAALAPYLAQLGISHVYCSPYLQAVPGSTHGYDVVDHSRLNEELGEEPAFERMVAALARHGLAHIADIVPNHMAIAGRHNAWWWDVLENGQSSRWASAFDIDWSPPEERLRQRVLLPVLGDHVGRVMESGELRLHRACTPSGATTSTTACTPSSPANGRGTTATTAMWVIWPGLAAGLRVRRPLFGVPPPAPRASPHGRSCQPLPGIRPDARPGRQPGAGRAAEHAGWARPLTHGGCPAAVLAVHAHAVPGRGAGCLDALPVLHRPRRPRAVEGRERGPAPGVRGLRLGTVRRARPPGPARSSDQGSTGRSWSGTRTPTSWTGTTGWSRCGGTCPSCGPVGSPA